MAAMALQYADIFVAFVSQQNWKRVAVIYYLDDVMITVC